MPRTAFNHIAPNPGHGSEYETLPQYLPAVLTDLTDAETQFHIHSITLTNVTDNSVIVTVQDKQATPLSLLGAVPIAAHTTVEAVFRGRWMPGGISWVADTANAIVGHMRVSK